MVSNLISVSIDRPISLLPSMSQVFEYVIFDEIMTLLRDNTRFCMEQFGFRPGHSTELADFPMVDHLTTEIDNSNVPTNIYIDLSKALGSRNHSILVKKLNHYGIYLVVHINFFVVIYRTDHDMLTLMVICRQNCLYQLVSLSDRSYNLYYFLYIEMTCLW